MRDGLIRVFVCTERPVEGSGWVVRESRLRYDVCLNPSPTVMAGGLLGRPYWIERSDGAPEPAPPSELLKYEPVDSPIFTEKTC